MSDSTPLKTNTDLVPAARREGDAVVATVRGEIDLHNSPAVRTTLLDLLAKHQPKRLVLNLAQVPYMDSSAIAVLVESLQKIRKHGGKIYLTDLQPRVKGLLEIARLDSIFVVAKDEADALTR
ncbi:MAG TPA: STAS domain-containing protein [Tepidisphaeraceae bacterium]|nr:STAS domain-containing protein [Tepidisphaeraceae bacterium]